MNRSELQQLQAHVRERISELEVLVARSDDSIANVQHAAVAFSAGESFP